MIWDKPIETRCAYITAEQAQAAWDGWIKSPLRTHVSLEWYIKATGARQLVRGRWPFSSAADRMLRKAKRGGVVYFKRGEWHMVEQEGRS